METMEKVRTRFENLKRSGIKEEQAWMWANTRKATGVLPIAQSCQEPYPTRGSNVLDT